MRCFQSVRLLAQLAVAVSLVAPTLASAQTQPAVIAPQLAEQEASDPRIEARPRPGLYLSAHLGVGELRADFSGYETWGRAFPLAVSAGAVVSSNLVLFAELYDAHVFGPISSNAATDSVDLYGIGGGLKYYLTRTNVFLSGSMLFSRLHLAANGESFSELHETSHLGLVGRASMGQDWWVSPGWWLGFSGELTFGRMARDSREAPDVPPYTATGFSLLFSGSFNDPTADEAGSSPSASQASVPSPLRSGDTFAGDRTHDGFYLSASLGPGWFALHPEEGSGTLSGMGSSFAVSAGYAVIRGLVLFGEFHEAYVLDPSDNGFGLEDLDMHGVGPGVRYYLGGANIFLGGSLLFSKVTFHNGTPADIRYGINRVSDWGVAGRFCTGKEWWVSSDWGLGLAAELLYGRMPERVGPSTDSTKGIALLMSATFN